MAVILVNYFGFHYLSGYFFFHVRNDLRCTETPWYHGDEYFRDQIASSFINQLSIFFSVLLTTLISSEPCIIMLVNTLGVILQFADVRYIAFSQLFDNFYASNHPHFT